MVIAYLVHGAAVAVPGAPSTDIATTTAATVARASTRLKNFPTVSPDSAE
jgi:hypothetical protein